MMKRCSRCMFCKKSMITDYIKDVDIYRCNIDNDIIFNPTEEGEDCAWFEAVVQKTILSSLLKYFL
ncbi:hypothetical protein SAMN02910342_00979 [Butyrivibrio sp. INlla21]|nr:hypothetical protein SAMN02910342_00979 [Butyrivibrio sp. INlla21]